MSRELGRSLGTTGVPSTSTGGSRPAVGHTSRTAALNGASSTATEVIDDGPDLTAGLLQPAGWVIQRKASGEPVADQVSIPDSEGAPLPTDVRTRFEGSLGADLGGVRVHTGAESAKAADAVGAQAFAVGNDIHFGQGTFQPDDPFGLHLLAHEVAHTQQQSAVGQARPQHKLMVSNAGDAAEHEADHAADAMVAGAPASISAAPVAIARSPSGVPGGPSGAPPKIVIQTPEWKAADVAWGPFKLGGSAAASIELENAGATPGGVKEVTVSPDKVKAAAEKKFSMLGYEPTGAGEIELSKKGIKANLGLKVKLGSGAELAGFEVKPPEVKFIAIGWENGEPVCAKLELKTETLSPILTTFQGYNVRAKVAVKLTGAPDYGKLLKMIAERVAPVLGVDGAVALGGVGVIATLLYAWSQCSKAADVPDELANATYDYVNGWAAGLRSEKMPAKKSRTMSKLVAGHIRGTDELVNKTKELDLPMAAIASAMKQQLSLAPDLWEKAWPPVKSGAIAEWEADPTKYADLKFFKMMMNGTGGKPMYSYATIASGGKA